MEGRKQLAYFFLLFYELSFFLSHPICWRSPPNSQCVEQQSAVLFRGFHKLKETGTTCLHRCDGEKN